MASSHLFFDPEIAGHHGEYAGHVLHHVRDHGYSHPVVYVVHPDFPRHFPELVEEASEVGGFRFQTLPPEDADTLAAGGSKVKVSMAWWQVLEEQARRFDAERCVLMEVNKFQFAIGTRTARQSGLEIRGILFFPYLRIEPQTRRLTDRVSSFFERGRKWLQTVWMLRNPHVSCLYILNDEEAAREMSKRHPQVPFLPLLDPVPVFPDAETIRSEALRTVLAPSDTSARLRMTLFGSLRRNKGVFVLLDALERLPDSVAAELEILFVGSVHNSIEDGFRGRLRSTMDRQPQMQLDLVDEYVDASDLRHVIEASDVILAPYVRTEGSSGVIGHAARYRTPVIGSGTGLIGELIAANDLGWTIDPVHADTLAARITDAVQQGHVPMKNAAAQQYVDKRTPDAFSRLLLAEAPSEGVNAAATSAATT